MDAQIIRPTQGNFAARNTGYANEPPLKHFLTSCYEEFKADNSGTVADYIPELKRANPEHFGVVLVTIDGHVYEVGDSAVRTNPIRRIVIAQSLLAYLFGAVIIGTVVNLVIDLG